MEEGVEIVDNGEGLAGTVEVSIDSSMEAPENTITVPDKFQNEDGSVNTDALVKSYLELEKSGVPTAEPEVEPKVETPEANESDFSIDTYYSKFDKGEDITAEDITAISTGLNVPDNLVQSYVELHTKQRSELTTKAQETADNTIYETTGGGGGLGLLLHISIPVRFVVVPQELPSLFAVCQVLPSLCYVLQLEHVEL